MSQTNVICVSHVGGQGKTTVTQLLNIIAGRAGIAMNLASADYLDASGRSKLGKLYPGRTTEFGVGASLTAARDENNANAPLRYWDKLGVIFLRDSHILDVGVNVFDDISTWALDRHLTQLIERRRAAKIDLVCVCKAEGHSLDNLNQLLGDVLERKPFPLRSITVVKNEVGGSFEADEVEKRLAAHKTALQFVEVPRCYSELWGTMERKRVSIETVLEETDDEKLGELLEVDLFTAVAGAAELRRWVDVVEQRVRLAGLFRSNDIG